MFTINNLTVKYEKKSVLSDLSLKIGIGSIYGIVGYNGAGKTTLLNSIFGLLAVPRDKFTYNGKILLRTQIAYLEAHNFFYSNITGRDYLKLFRQKNANFNIELWQNIFNLPLDDLIENYSTGMKKKLALLGVLSLDKELIILDEPFNGLDVESVAVLQIIIQKLIDKNKTIIITSHIVETLTAICDSIALLKEGTIQRVYNDTDFNELTRSINDEMKEKYNLMIDTVLSV
jgi:ABC-2 type transport system ATP-binding protein